MEDPRVAVVAASRRTSEFLVAHMREVLGGAGCPLRFDAYCLEAGLRPLGDYPLVLVSSASLAPEVSRYAEVGTDILVMRRTLRRASWERLMGLPPRTRAMLVNDDQGSAANVISLIYELGVRHLDLVPVWPGLEEVPPLEIAITPGEAHLVPPFVRQVIDIGYRVVDATTLVDVLSKFGMFDTRANRLISDYVQGIIPRSPGLWFILARMAEMRSQMEGLLDAVGEGVMGFDLQHRVNVLNRKAEEILGRPAWTVLGRPLAEVLPPLPEGCGLDGEERISDEVWHLGSRRVIVTHIPVSRNGQPAGGVLRMREAEEIVQLEGKLRSQLRNKGHVAKYTFAHVKGVSRAIRAVVARAESFSRSSSAVLIYGETGTGKELFAHAIHNASPRRAYPFVAVNCAAVPETLLESELFGYEEGAFTGARKGGKAGYFEQAHRGTIFLDEIADMPLSVQARILRVVQEKEVVRVGGTRVIPVDVRVIAATNRDLKRLVEQGAFRADLYYRLNVLPLHIPPLRERPEDILPLARYFLEARQSSLVLSPETCAILQSYPWPGNVRELENCIEYLISVARGVATPDDLPEAIRAGSCGNAGAAPPGGRGNAAASGDVAGCAEKGRPDPVVAVLAEIARASEMGMAVGRRSLARALGGLSEHELRTILKRLHRAGLVVQKRGRAGTTITALGREFLRRNGHLGAGGGAGGA